MSDRENFGSPDTPYGGRPPTGDQPQPQYPQYPQPQAGQNPYPPYPPQPYGYPPQPYGYPPVYPAYPVTPAGPKRPGLTIAAAVLGYINAGMLILAGALLLFGASIANDLENNYDTGTDYSTEIAFDGFVNLIAAGLLIAGAVMFTGRKSSGRALFAVGNGIVIAEAIYWLVRFNDELSDNNSGFIVWAVLFGALAVLPLAFSFTTDVNRWLRGEPFNG